MTPLPLVLNPRYTVPFEWSPPGLYTGTAGINFYTKSFREKKLASLQAYTSHCKLADHLFCRLFALGFKCLFTSLVSKNILSESAFYFV